MRRYRFVEPILGGFFLCLLLVHPAQAQQQVTVTGVVREADSGHTLPKANLRVLGTELGTTTNLEGQYRLLLPAGTHRLVFSYLGFQSDTLQVSAPALGQVVSDVALRPAVLAAGEITVYADDVDPAEALIRQVIAHKQDVLSRLRSYQFDAYTKTVLRIVEEDGFIGPDTLIAGILETQTGGSWKAPSDYKEIVKARRQTANYAASQNFFTAGRIPNFNDDLVTVGNKAVVGPTAPNALSYYEYEVVDTVAFDENVVYRLRIRPTTNLVPLFEGIIAIAAATHQVMDVDVRGNEALDLAPLKDLRLRQQFALYKEQFWLPILVQSTYSLKLTLPPAPPVYTEQVSLIYDYRINEGVGSDAFDAYLTSVLPGADRPDAARWSRENLLPLTTQEADAYQMWDSLMTHAGILERSMLLATRLPARMRSLPLTGPSDFFRFNRVEGAHVGGGFQFENVLPATDVAVRGGYGFARQGWTYGVEAVRHLGAARKSAVGVEVHEAVGYREQLGASRLSRGAITWATLMGHNDPVDYYLRSGWSVFGRMQPSWVWAITVRYLDEQQASLAQQTNFSLLNASATYRPNPRIRDGRLRSGLLTLRYDTEKLRETPFLDLPDESRNRWLAMLEIERSDAALLRSDFDFTRYALTLQRRQHLFGFSTLNAYAYLGYAGGALPPQRLYDLVASPNSPHRAAGALRLLQVKEFAGDRVATAQVNYNLGSVPFRALSLPFLQRLDLILYSGLGWADLSAASMALQTEEIAPTGGLYQEAGFGLGRLFSLFRLDFTWRLTHRTSQNFGMALKSTLF